jgi:Mg-chelatase subunit ChlD
MPAERITSLSPWHLVLVLDDSGSMAGQPATMLNEAVRRMVDEMVLFSGGQKPYFRLSVISFGSQARLLSEMMSETDVRVDAVASFQGNSGVTNAQAALNLACEVLQRNPGAPEFFEPFVFFLSDGAPYDGTSAERSKEEALKSADRLKGLDLASGRPRLIAIGIGDVDDDFMVKISTNLQGQPRYRKLEKASDVLTFFPEIGTIAASQVARAGKSGADMVESAIIEI